MGVKRINHWAFQATLLQTDVDFRDYLPASVLNNAEAFYQEVMRLLSPIELISEVEQIELLHKKDFTELAEKIAAYIHHEENRARELFGFIPATTREFILEPPLAIIPKDVFTYGNLNNLTTLKLITIAQEIGEHRLFWLSKSIAKLPLKKLSIKNTQIRYLPNTLGNLKVLEKLIIKNNPIDTF